MDGRPANLRPDVSVGQNGDVVVRPAGLEDFGAWIALYEQVAMEGLWIGGEAPVDRDARLQRFQESVGAPDQVTLFAEVGGELAGMLFVGLQRGIAQLGVMVAAEWRGRGVGSKLMTHCIAWCRQHGAHKVTLTVWPHNAAAIALYRKFGFVEEARLRRHYRRRNGELWDGIEMGFVLDEDSPGSPYDPAAE